MQQTDSCKSQVTSEPSHRAHAAPWRKETCIYMFQFLASFLRQVSFSSYFLLNIRLSQSNVCVVPPLMASNTFPGSQLLKQIFSGNTRCLLFPNSFSHWTPSLSAFMSLYTTAALLTCSHRHELHVKQVCRRSDALAPSWNWSRGHQTPRHLFQSLWQLIFTSLRCCSGTSLTQGLFTGWKGQALSFGPQMALSQLFLSVKQMRKKMILASKLHNLGILISSQKQAAVTVLVW